MSESQNIFGCFVSSHASLRDSFQIAPSEPGEIFRQFVWGKNGICEVLKTLSFRKYGTDLRLVLFQFYVNPMPERRKQLKEIEKYRKDERAIGVPIIVTDENFFNSAEDERRRFLKNTILEKLDILAGVIKKNKLDTDIALLKSDVEKLSF